MSINLLETVQQNLDYPALQKIDPNTGTTTSDNNNGIENKFSQAAIPAVLTGLYRYVQSDEGAGEILQLANSTIWINKFFETDKNAVVQAISDYSNRSYEEVESQMNAIANEAVKIIKENLPDNSGIKDVKVFLRNQKNNILLHLLPALNIGRLLNDDTLDDNTNKMEGPVSSLMQNIGSAFSSPVTGEDINTR